MGNLGGLSAAVSRFIDLFRFGRDRSWSGDGSSDGEGWHSVELSGDPVPPKKFQSLPLQEPGTSLPLGQSDRLDVYIRDLTDTLVNGKTDRDGYLRSKAAWTLGHIGPDAQAAIPMLIEASKVQNDDLRAKSVRALQLIRIEIEARPSSLIDMVKTELFGVRSGIDTELVGEDRLDATIKNLSRAVRGERTTTFRMGIDDLPKATWALGKIGPNAKEAVPLLVEALKDQNADLRSEAATALREIGASAKEAVPALADALDDPSVRERVAHALWYIGAGREAVPALIMAAADENYHTHSSAVQALGRIGEEAVADLVMVLRNGDTKVRRGVIQALYEAGKATHWDKGYLPAMIVPALVQALRDQDDQVRAAAAGDLEYIGQSHPSIPTILPALVKALGDPNESVRCSVAQAIGSLGFSYKTPPPELVPALPPLIGALKDKSMPVVRAAAEAIGKLRKIAKDAVPALIEALDGADDGHHCYLAKALGEIGPDARQATFSLIVTLIGKDRYDRLRAAEALGRIDPPLESAVPAPIHALRDEEDVVRQCAAEALGRIGPGAEAAVLALIEVLEKDTYQFASSHAAQALGRMGPAAQLAVPVLIETLKHFNEYTRGSAAEALGKIGPVTETVVPALIEALGNDIDFLYYRGTWGD